MTHGQRADYWTFGSRLWIYSMALTSAGCSDAGVQPIGMDTAREVADAGEETRSRDATQSQTTSPSGNDDLTGETGTSDHDARAETQANNSGADAGDAETTDDAGWGSGVVDASVTTAVDAGSDASNEVGAEPDGASPHELLDRARAEYRAWEPRTAEPVPISSQIFALCRLPTQAESDFVESVHGDELALQDWPNEAASEGIAAIDAAASGGNDEAITFAVGATIVKEKVAWRDGAWELAALGLMIKREPGFDPSHGDWQFGYWDPELGMESGSEAQVSCGDCHAFAGTDFVYADDSWRQ